MPGSALLVFGLAYCRGSFAAHLSRPWLQRLGMASFSFYMLHTPMMRAMKGVYYYLGWETRTWTGFWLVTVAAFIVIQVAALIMLYKFELPMQQWLRSWRTRRAPAQDVQQIPAPAPGFSPVRLPLRDSTVWEKLV